VRDWPPITDQELLERLALADEEFIAYVHNLWNAVGAREFPAGAVERALGYPWERPAAASYVLRGQQVESLDGTDRGAFTADRHPLLAYGGNAAPTWLTAKFAHFPDEADRTVLVLAGELHDFDVGPAASLAPFGYMPATIFASPGTTVRASIVWATAAQVTQLTWSEIPYRLVRLDDAHFVPDEADVLIDEIFAYVHRLGTFCPDGSPVALAAVPAANRIAPALTQEQLLDVAAGMLFGPDARAADLVGTVFADMAGVVSRSSETLWLRSQQLQSTWTAFPGGLGS
jgi:hypothetical protein